MGEEVEVEENENENEKEEEEKEVEEEEKEEDVTKGVPSGVSTSYRKCHITKDQRRDVSKGAHYDAQYGAQSGLRMAHNMLLLCSFSP